MGRKTVWELGEIIARDNSTIRVIICQGKKEEIFYTEGTECTEVTEKSEEKDNAEAQS
jgi:hypothetical protein